MSDFTTNVGHQLRQAREARSLTIDQVAQATRIRQHYLRAMESGDFSALPSMAQARGFLRAYASFLNLDADPLLVALEGKEIPTTPISASTPAARQSANVTPDQLEQAGAIFVALGQQLQRQRELLGLSLEDVERHTHLRQHYLRALEAGDLDGLPSPVQGRGMLNNYAAFLGLDAEPLLLRFAEGLQTRLAARQTSARPTPRPERARRQKSSIPAPIRRFFSGDVLIGGALAFFLVIFAAWGAIRIFTMTMNQESTPTAPSIADVLLATSTSTATATLLPPTPTPPLPPQLFPTQVVATDAQTGAIVTLQTQPGVQVYVTVLQRTWMRAIVDGKVEFEGRVLPGSAYPFAGESAIEILTGNGAALRIFYNNQDLGLMGGFGQVANQVYTLQGVLNPTPTPTLTPAATTPPPPQATPSAAQPGQATTPALP